MKLLYCPTCGDIFNLDIRVKRCYCGAVVGRYLGRVGAEVNGEGISLAIGTGSFDAAVMAAAAGEPREDFRDSGDVWRRHPTSIIAWARPHEGPANPHTRINKELK